MIESQQFKDGLKSLEVLTFDEADRLVDFEYKDELTKILEYLPKQRRTAIFSATLGDNMEQFQKLGLRNPVKIQLAISILLIVYKTNM